MKSFSQVPVEKVHQLFNVGDQFVKTLCLLGKQHLLAFKVTPVDGLDDLLQSVRLHQEGLSQLLPFVYTLIESFLAFATWPLVPEILQ